MTCERLCCRPCASLAPSTNRKLAIHLIVLALQPRSIRGWFRIQMQIKGTRLTMTDRRGLRQAGELGCDLSLQQLWNCRLLRRTFGMRLNSPVSPLVALGGDLRYRHKRNRYNNTSQSAFDRQHRPSPHSLTVRSISVGGECLRPVTSAFRARGVGLRLKSGKWAAQRCGSGDPALAAAATAEENQ